MKAEVDITLAPQQLAAAFCELTDDGMALFFEAVAKQAETWRGPGAYPGMQWYRTGRHLRECSCISNAGRNVIDEIHSAMHYEGP